MRVLSGGFPMITNMPGLRWFSKTFASLCFAKKSNLSIGRVKDIAALMSGPLTCIQTVFNPFMPTAAKGSLTMLVRYLR